MSLDLMTTPVAPTSRIRVGWLSLVHISFPMLQLWFALAKPNDSFRSTPGGMAVSTAWPRAPFCDKNPYTGQTVLLEKGVKQPLIYKSMRTVVRALPTDEKCSARAVSVYV
tara:strand:- start:225 stop:557 length:333 start_codon:yes stop_codon:yes gene_type:complete